uniref:Pentraxin n=1 Tax=Spermophilus dauricus TaxID=99837 RepID=A0A8C9QEE5_SPEDA
MEKLLPGALLLSVPSGDATQSDMRGKVFVFPQESATASVYLIPQVKKLLQGLHAVLKSFSAFTCPYSLFSFNTWDQDNELLFFVDRIEEFTLSVGNAEATLQAHQSPLIPQSICASGSRGRKGLRKGYSLGAEAKIILGQEQDSFGGHFDAKQSFVGEVWEVSLGDHILPLSEMCDWCYQDNILNCQALIHEDSEDVVTKPKVWPRSLILSSMICVTSL